MYSGIIDSNEGVSKRIKVAAQTFNGAVRMVLDQLHKDLKEWLEKYEAKQIDLKQTQEKHEVKKEDEKVLEVKSLLAEIEALSGSEKIDIDGAKKLIAEMLKNTELFNKLPVKTQNKLRELNRKLNNPGNKEQAASALNSDSDEIFKPGVIV